MILAGDVGGTKTVVTLYERAERGLELRAEDVYASGDFGCLEEVIERFRAEQPGAAIEAACFGVAGPVLDGRASTTNLPWAGVEEPSLARALGAPVKLLNDLEAAAYGMLVLPGAALVPLNPEAEVAPQRNAGVLAAGTGLGEAFLIWDGARHRAVPGEGGHADFAPRSDEEVELLCFLRDRLGGRVSWERVLSGPGFLDLYRFARGRSAVPEPDWLTRRMAEGDPSAVVSQAALEQADPTCQRAMELFVSAYGAEAGNMALRCLALRGIFLGGGIAPKILPALESGRFMQAFLDKGRFEPLLRRIPVFVATEPRAPILGAANVAAELGGRS